MNDIAVLYSRSIFQISSQQRTRFNELAKMAKMLHDSCQEGEQVLPGFTNIIGDVWIAFYALYPELIPNAEQIDEMQHKFIGNLITTDDYVRWHTLTEGDELLSALTAIAITEQLKKTLQDNKVARQASAQIKLAERSMEHARKQLQELRKKMLDASLTQAEKERVAMQKDMIQRRLLAAKQDMVQGNRTLCQQVVQMDGKHIGDMIQLSVKKVKNTRNAIVAVGTMDGRKMGQVPLSDQFELAILIRQQKTLKKIADMAGRFKKMAQKKQKTKQRMTMERKNVMFGQEVSRLLPTELANLISPYRKLDFLRRYGEQQTLVFDIKGKDRRGKGPIIICMDESSSMSSIKEQSKAFCMALLMIARKQKRDFAIIPFASNIGEVQIFHKGRATINELIYFSENFLGGGTNYEKPLRASLDIFMQSNFSKADLLFVTDGSSFLPTSFIEEFNTIKKTKQFECTAILLTNLYNAVDLTIVERFSDKIIEVNDLFEADDAFSI
ncbi:vWA domain-containing protein [Solibacillus sp. FSL H8-0538]|uniref:vWA domain-containing protein n=1 Tax=Solibacillus sp. FSL H8-0538 TaxID=2921400 RepID=UPI0030F7B3A0